MSDQCTLGPDSQLLDASKIIFYNDPDNTTPLPPALPSLPVADNSHAPSCPGRTWNNTRMRQILQAEKEDDNRNPPVKRQANKTKKLPSTSTPLDNTDVEDEDFVSGRDVKLDSEDSEDSEDDVRIANEEVRMMILRC